MRSEGLPVSVLVERRFVFPTRFEAGARGENRRHRRLSEETRRTAAAAVTTSGQYYWCISEATVLGGGCEGRVCKGRALVERPRMRMHPHSGEGLETRTGESRNPQG